MQYTSCGLVRAKDPFGRTDDLTKRKRVLPAKNDNTSRNLSGRYCRATYNRQSTRGCRASGTTRCRGGGRRLRQGGRLRNEKKRNATEASRRFDALALLWICLCGFFRCRSGGHLPEGGILVDPFLRRIAHARIDLEEVGGSGFDAGGGEFGDLLHAGGALFVGEFFVVGCALVDLGERLHEIEDEECRSSRNANRNCAVHQLKTIPVGLRSDFAESINVDVGEFFELVLATRLYDEGCDFKISGAQNLTFVQAEIGAEHGDAGVVTGQEIAVHELGVIDRSAE